MTHPRIRRLQSEYRDMLELAQSSSLISFTSRGSPPTRYEVTLTCTGLICVNNEIFRAEDHRFELTLDDSFPMTAPDIVWRTAVFHPNIKPPQVCTGDIWYPAYSLAELCVSLCELVQYKSFNIYDPLDIEAAAWLHNLLQSDRPEIPVDHRPVRNVQFDIVIQSPPSGA